MKSAGTEPSARIKLNSKIIEWADYIFVMEKKHKQRMSENFPTEIKDKRIIILNISNVFKYMNPELIEEIKSKVEDYIK